MNNQKEENGEIKHEQPSYEFKISTLGLWGCGKTSLLNELKRKGSFNPHTVTTLGLSFVTVTKVINDEVIRFILFDTSGQEKHRAITTSSYRDMHGTVLVYDLTRRQPSIERLYDDFDEIKERNVNECPIMIVGNKLDLIQEERDQVECNSELKELCGKLNVHSGFLTSAKTHANISEAFQPFFKYIYDTFRNEDTKIKQEPPPIIDGWDHIKRPKKKNCCSS
mmetsp:Transcript_11512/g.17048  ORF Transcript_11512/g.17048 Transcript_11512/m.17048 type:complete len:223 (+) Transcript_11512:18-686(+)